jgi:biotin carboxylase
MHKQSLSVLVVADLYVLPYKVLFCLRDAGIRNVYVLANNRSSRLRYTRFCKQVITTKTNFDCSEIEKSLNQINQYVKKLGIDVVIAGDQHSTRLLTIVQSRVATKCFPLPDEKSYNILYDKWEFRRICKEQDILYPESELVPDIAALLDKIVSKTISYPFICKPIDLEAGNGILKVDEENAFEQIQRLYYNPILIQRFIEGEDIGASVYCEKGIIKNFIAHSFRRQKYYTFLNDEIYNSIAKILDSLGVSGVFNFDMRLSPQGEIYFLECNPRFFIKMIMSALAGVNFVAAGLGLPTRTYVEHGTHVKMPWAFGLTLLTKPHRISRRDIHTLLKMAMDPVPFAGELFGATWSDVETPINYYLESRKNHVSMQCQLADTARVLGTATIVS